MKMERVVRNVFWTDGCRDESNLYVLYSDSTYEVIMVPNGYYSRNRKTGENFKKFLNARIFRIKKFTQKEVHDYIKEKVKEWYEKES